MKRTRYNITAWLRLATALAGHPLPAPAVHPETARRTVGEAGTVRNYLCHREAGTVPPYARWQSAYSILALRAYLEDLAGRVPKEIIHGGCRFHRLPAWRWLEHSSGSTRDRVPQWLLLYADDVYGKVMGFPLEGYVTARGHNFDVPSEEVCHG